MGLDPSGPRADAAPDMATIEHGRVEVYTYKEGLLGRAAHDLRLTVHGFSIEGTPEHVEARFDIRSFRVDGAMRDGRLDERALGERDKREILENVREKILHADRPLRFEGRAEAEGGGYRVEGELEMAGERRALSLSLDRAGDRLQGEVELTPSRWGIKPFKALMGAIKLQDRVRVRFELPLPE